MLIYDCMRHDRRPLRFVSPYATIAREKVGQKKQLMSDSNTRAEHAMAPNVAGTRPEPPVRSERFLRDGQHPENNNGLEPRRRKLEAD